MNRQKRTWPKGNGTYCGLLPKRISRDAVLSMAEIKELPDTDASELFPMPFLAVLDDQLRNYRKNDALRRGLIATLSLTGPARTDAITFVLSLAAFRIWRNSTDQENSEKLVAAALKRGGRRASQLGLRNFHEKKPLTRLSKLIQRQTVARWQAYITYGFALRHHPENATPRILEEFRDALTRYAFDRDPAQVRSRRIGAVPLNSIRANVFRFRAQYGQEFTQLSKTHFDVLQRFLTQPRGLVAPHLRIANW